MLDSRFDVRRQPLSLALALGVLALSLAPALNAQPATAPGSHDTVLLQVTVDHNGRPLAAPRLFGKLGEAMAVEMRPAAAALASAGAAPAWRLQVTPDAESASLLRLQMQLSAGVPLVVWAHPRWLRLRATPHASRPAARMVCTASACRWWRGGHRRLTPSARRADCRAASRACATFGGRPCLYSAQLRKPAKMSLRSGV